MRVTIRRRQGDFLVNVAFRAPDSGIIALFGPSGAGKSSVINMLAGLYRPDEGSIVVRGRCLFDSERGINLPPEQRNIGYVFQDDLLFPHLSVQGNLLYGRRRKNAGSEAAGFDQVVDLLGIRPLLARKPRTLSGGERQRVAFGRAVLSNPDILLMDEPLASLDASRKEELLPFIKELNARFAVPVVYVSHSPDEIRALTDNVLLLHNGCAANGSIHGAPALPPDREPLHTCRNPLPTP